MVMQVAVKQRLALLRQADGHVKLGTRLFRHQPAQERHVGCGRLHVDEKIGAREREQHQELILAGQQSIEIELAALVLQNRYRERQLALRVDHAADYVSALVAEKERRQNL